MLLISAVFFNIFFYSLIPASANEKVPYEMPYPGLLPDHPLYPLKAARDRILDYSTRDSIKKAQLYLLFSDKRIVMAQQLSKKGKVKPAISVLSKGEKYFLKIPDLLKAAKQQGRTPPPELVQQVRQSNKKHQEIMAILQRDLPEGNLEELKQVITLNQQIQKDLKNL